MPETTEFASPSHTPIRQEEANTKKSSGTPDQAVPATKSDRPGGPSIWLYCAAAGLLVLSGAAAAVSFTAQYRLVFAARGIAVAAALEAAIPDAAALVFACLGVALALHGRHAIRARLLNAASAGTSVFMNVIAAAPGWRDVAVWVMPPAAYALASDTLIGVVRVRVVSHQRDLASGVATEDIGKARHRNRHRPRRPPAPRPGKPGRWIAETEAERAKHEFSTLRATGNLRMTEAEIEAIVEKLGDIAEVLGSADPNDKAEIFRRLGLRLTYHPGRRLVAATVEPAGYGFFESVRGAYAPKSQYVPFLTSEFALDTVAVCGDRSGRDHPWQLPQPSSAGLSAPTVEAAAIAAGREPPRSLYLVASGRRPGTAAAGLRGFLPSAADRAPRATRAGRANRVLIASHVRCDALIITDDPRDPVQVVPLPEMTLSMATEHAFRLLTAQRTAADPERDLAARTAAEEDILATLAWPWDTRAGPVPAALGHRASVHDVAAGPLRLVVPRRLLALLHAVPST
jgi:hypothetical protein